MTSEKVLYEQVVAAFRQLGFEVTRLSQARASKQTRGIPDLYIRRGSMTGPSVRAWVEVKTPMGTLTRAQKDWHLGERLAGGEVYIVRSMDDVVRIAGLLGVRVRA